MEFSEIGEKFEGLTADQVCNLAMFGRNVLEAGLTSDLIPFIRSILRADDFDIEENKSIIETLLHIAQLLSDINDKCWSERKTLLGLMGVGTEDGFFQLNGANQFELKK